MELLLYHYNAQVTSVVDGDNIMVDIDLGFSTWRKDISIRLLGLDAPESRTKDLVEKVFGKASLRFVEKFIEECNNEIIVRTIINKNDKFGRVLGIVYNPITNIVLNDLMIVEGYAVPYNGTESKESLQLLHLANRNRLILEGKVVIPDIS
jgi:endonuclease YncB( thermonuclease family)